MINRVINLFVMTYSDVVIAYFYLTIIHLPSQYRVMGARQWSLFEEV